ncbi:3565_t:CDS:2, partial [Ambispora leptoticha]
YTSEIGPSSTLVSRQDLDYESWDSMLNSIKRRISNLYMEHRYILDNKKLYTNDKSYFENILNEIIDGSRLMDALSSLTRYLYEYFGRNIIILIDEYDWPMEHARNFYDRANTFFRSMYSSVAKDNALVYKILFVGILPLDQASFLSGLNNVMHYPMHRLPGINGRANFSDMFGFTQKEVEILLSKSTQNIEIDTLSAYYNGYQTSTGVCIYNPHSIMSSLDTGNIEDYW